VKKEISGYWMFMCNPSVWEIDRFLESGAIEDTYSISDFHKDHFKQGQLGIIRVGKDSRSKKRLGDKPRLLAGIYAVVRVISEPELLVSEKGDFWIEKEESLKQRYRVRLAYTSIHLLDPVLLDDLKETSVVKDDPLIIKGIQASTYPISKDSFDLIAAMLQDHQFFTDGALLEEAFDGFYPRNSLIEPLMKNVGSSQFTDGVRIEKDYHHIFNPPDTEFYSKRGTARRIRVLFNNRVFLAEYRYEGQRDESVQLQSIRFRQDLKKEFMDVFPDWAGTFSISVGRDLNHFIFDIRSKDESPDAIEEQEYSEGKQYYKQHVMRERNPKLMKEAKELFIRQHGCLYCEVCKYNFEDHFGDRGRDFIEGHHTKYVSELAPGEGTKITDIVMLCPNCHRMIHRKPRISFEDLKALYR
jgi:predicted RNA-binding protein with PUA-like domain